MSDDVFNQLSDLDKATPSCVVVFPGSVWLVVKPTYEEVLEALDGPGIWLEVTMVHSLGPTGTSGQELTKARIRKETVVALREVTPVMWDDVEKDQRANLTRAGLFGTGGFG